MSSASAAKKQVPLMEGLFVFPSKEAKLIASKCKKCGFVSFPATFRCPDSACMGDKMEQIHLTPRGKLWSYTVDYYPLPPPFKPPKGGFKPFGIGEVEFPEGVRVAGVITGCDAEKDLKIGMNMETVLESLYDDDGGNEVIGWKFRPAK